MKFVITPETKSDGSPVLAGERIGRLRARDPTEALRSLLGELRLERYPCLQGRTFSLQVGAGRGTHEVWLVPRPAADEAARGSLSGPAGV